MQSRLSRCSVSHLRRTYSVLHEHVFVIIDWKRMFSLLFHNCTTHATSRKTEANHAMDTHNTAQKLWTQHERKTTDATATTHAITPQSMLCVPPEANLPCFIHELMFEERQKTQRNEIARSLIANESYHSCPRRAEHATSRKMDTNIATDTHYTVQN